MEQMLKIGLIVKPQGIKGEVKIQPLTDDINRFKKLKEVIIDDKNYRVLKATIGGGTVFLSVAMAIAIFMLLPLAVVSFIDEEENLIACNFNAVDHSHINEVIRLAPDENGQEVWSTNNPTYVYIDSDVTGTDSCLRGIIVSTSEPTQDKGNNGDIWIVYSN